VRFGSGRNKFVQLLIRSRNSSGWFVRSLAKIVSSTTGVLSKLHSQSYFPSVYCVGTVFAFELICLQLTMHDLKHKQTNRLTEHYITANH